MDIRGNISVRCCGSNQAPIQWGQEHSVCDSKEHVEVGRAWMDCSGPRQSNVGHAQVFDAGVSGWMNERTERMVNLVLLHS